jgi:multiple antibiotic resistance protein
LIFALLLHALITFLVTLDPIGLAPIFVGLAGQKSDAENRRLARTGVVVAAVVLFLFALVGRWLLDALGVSLAAFRIAGGVLLFLLAIDMVLARQSGLRSTTTGETVEAQTRQDIAVFPLAIPLIAGPGTMASVILLMDKAEGVGGQILVLAVLAFVLFLTFLALRSALALTKVLGVTGTNVIGRVAGIVLAALAVQFVLDGITAIFPLKG